jgi:hypothetical protein
MVKKNHEQPHLLEKKMKKKKPFKAFFIFELKQLLTTRNTVLLVIFALISLYFVQVGSSSYREQLEIKQETKEISHKEVLPAVSVLFYNNIRDSKILLKRGLSPTDFFGWLYLVGSLVILFYGYETFRDISRMRMLLGQMGRHRLFLTTIGSRYVMIFLVFLPFLVLAAFLIFANGIEFSRPDFVTAFRFVVLWLVFSAVFFVSGSLMGLLPSSVAGKSGKASVFALWVGFVYLYPLALDNIVIDPIDHSFEVGIMTMVCLFVLLCCISYMVFKNKLFASKLDAKSIQEFTSTRIYITLGMLNVFQIGKRDTADLFFALSNQTPQVLSMKGLRENITIDGSPFSRKCDINVETGKVNLQYFPPPGSLMCEATTRSFLEFLIDLTGQSDDTLEAILKDDTIFHFRDVPVSELSEAEQGLFMLQIAPFFSSHFYLFDNIATGMNSQLTLKFKQLMDQLAGSGSTAIYVTSNSSISLRGNTSNILKDEFWGEGVEKYNQLKFRVG